jgi:dipeptidyl aminopeptidase/acylaminoacyl peptidase
MLPRTATFFLVLIFSGMAAAAETEKRVALIIGNSAYIRHRPLANPVNDAKAMAQRLKTQGFEVFASYDAGQRDMKRSVQDFAAALRTRGKDVVAFIFYAGHGVQVKGENYLIPVDENIKSEGDVDIDAVSLSSIMSMLENAQTRLAIVVLDACRDNPFGYARGGARGLAQVDAPSGSLIAFSTSPGKTAPDGPAGGNSYYTAALAQTMAEPGVRIEEVFKKVRIAVHGKTKGEQIPWESTSLTGDFYPAGKPAQDAAGPGKPRDPQVPAIEPFEQAPGQKPADTEVAAIGPAEQLQRLTPTPEQPLPVRTFTGHTMEVRAVAFSPDGRTALSGSTGIKLWDIASGLELLTFAGHTNQVNTVAFSPDGRTALSGSTDWSNEDKLLKLWDIESGRELRSFKAHNGYIRSVAFSPDGRTALSGDNHGMLKLWDIASGRELLRGRSHNAEVNSVAFSPDARTVLSSSPGNWEGTLKLWDIVSGRELRSFTEHGNDRCYPGGPAAFSPDGSTALSAYRCEDIMLRLWDVASGRVLRSFKSDPSSKVNSIAISPDGRMALSGSDNGMLKLWDLASGREVSSFMADTDPRTGRACSPNTQCHVYSAVFSPDGRFALSGSHDRTLKLWDISEWTQPREARR